MRDMHKKSPAIDFIAKRRELAKAVSIALCVVLPHAGTAAQFELSDLNGQNGFVINGIDAADLSGYSVSGVGDINGDGVDDLIIGAHSADKNAGTDAGESYVVFGNMAFGGVNTLELTDLDGSDGFVINGIGFGDQSGRSVSGAGGINGDGIDDLIKQEMTRSMEVWMLMICVVVVVLIRSAATTAMM